MSLELAKTIISQLQSGTDANGKSSGIKLMMCWGFENPRYLNRTTKSYGGLIFNVSGLCHQGLVKITLNGVDTYDIEFLSKDEEVLHSIKDIYDDMLTPIVDSYVESNLMSHHCEEKKTA